MAADRMNINRSWDHIQAKYVGTGHSDMTKFEWASNQHRDSIASHLGHSDIMTYFAVAQGDSIGRTRYALPCVRSRRTVKRSTCCHPWRMKIRSPATGR